MQPGPQPMNRQQLQLADARSTLSLQAIGLYRSVARRQNEPYADIELFCILTDPGEAWNRKETELRREIAQQDEHGRRLCIIPFSQMSAGTLYAGASGACIPWRLNLQETSSTACGSRE
ncbi:MAG TPA: hypothetical protein VGF67_03790 [Ktedonobacteraceae bacterium]